MKIKNTTTNLNISAATVELCEDYGIVIDKSFVQAYQQTVSKEVDRLLIVEGCICEPVLMVEWRYFWGEDDQFTLERLEYDNNDLQQLYTIGIL